MMEGVEGRVYEKGWNGPKINTEHFTQIQKNIRSSQHLMGVSPKLTQIQLKSQHIQKLIQYSASYLTKPDYI